MQYEKKLLRAKSATILDFHQISIEKSVKEVHMII
jgi:hypothetical protein